MRPIFEKMPGHVQDRRQIFRTLGSVELKKTDVILPRPPFSRGSARKTAFFRPPEFCKKRPRRTGKFRIFLAGVKISDPAKFPAGPRKSGSWPTPGNGLSGAFFRTLEMASPDPENGLPRPGKWPPQTRKMASPDQVPGPQKSPVWTPEIAFPAHFPARPQKS